MNIHLARHHGMCFGVRDALRATHDAARKAPVTILGQLVHNPVVDQHLRTLGVQAGRPRRPAAAADARCRHHRARRRGPQREALKQAGFRITDTTCPLVRKAHDALASLVEADIFPSSSARRRMSKCAG